MCRHKNFLANSNMVRYEKPNTEELKFCLEASVQCLDCGVRFAFKGIESVDVPDIDEPGASPDSLTISIPCIPSDQYNLPQQVKNRVFPTDN